MPISKEGDYFPSSKHVYLLILSVQQTLVDPAGQVTPQTLVLQAGPGYLYRLLVLAYLDPGYQGSPFLLLFQEILGKREDTELVPSRTKETQLTSIPQNVLPWFRNYVAEDSKTVSLVTSREQKYSSFPVCRLDPVHITHNNLRKLNKMADIFSALALCLDQMDEVRCHASCTPPTKQVTSNL